MPFQQYFYAKGRTKAEFIKSDGCKLIKKNKQINSIWGKHLRREDCTELQFQNVLLLHPDSFPLSPPDCGSSGHRKILWGLAVSFLLSSTILKPRALSALRKFLFQTEWSPWIWPLELALVCAHACQEVNKIKGLKTEIQLTTFTKLHICSLMYCFVFDTMYYSWAPIRYQGSVSNQ